METALTCTTYVSINGILYDPTLDPGVGKPEIVKHARESAVSIDDSRPTACAACWPLVYDLDKFVDPHRLPTAALASLSGSSHAVIRPYINLVPLEASS